MENFLAALRTQRWDDHRYYHHSRINQSLHFVSALSFLFAYVMLFKDPAIGPDSYLGMLASTLYGSSETTFYVLAVYFGAAGVRRIRHALVAGLAADLVALAAATLVCGWLYR